MSNTLSAPVAAGSRGPGIADSAIAVFECVNAVRAGLAPGGASRRRPAPSAFHWPIPAAQVRLPCAGRLQPEQLLKAFEAGYDAVCVIACAADNCHCVEGSQRARRRVDYVRGLLDEMGLGGNRLLFFSLPGSAREDLDLGLGKPAGPPPAQEPAAAAVVDQAMRAIALLPPSPLRGNRPATEPVEKDTQASEAEESD